MLRAALLAAVAFALVLAFPAPVTGDVRQSTKDEEQELQSYGVGSPPLRRLMMRRRRTSTRAPAHAARVQC